MRVAKLIDDKGRQIEKPESFSGSVSWDLTSGQAHAWAEDGKTLIAEMVGARAVWITATGVRLEGQEPIDLGGTRYRLQSWQIIFD